MICGSPRGFKSASNSFLKKVEAKLDGNEVGYFYIVNKTDDKTIDRILEFDTLVFSFPNYFGGIPSGLLSVIEKIGGRAIKSQISNKIVYAVVNCGFYYSDENKVALETIHCFCKTVGFKYGKGISIGGGGSVEIISKIPLVNLYLRPITRGIGHLTDAIRNKKQEDDEYLEISMPIKLYIFIAERIWYLKASKNGLKGKHALDTI